MPSNHSSGTVHQVQEGETLASIAWQYGFRNLETLWDHPENRAFVAARPDPNLLYPGDEIFIPEKQPKEHRCETNQAHTFTVRSRLVPFRVHLHDEDGIPYVGKRYKLEAGDQVLEGTTGADGLVEQRVSPLLTELSLTVWDEDEAGHTWHIALRAPDPITTVRGLKTRLNNLGFPCGAVDDTFDEQAEAALLAFQEAVGHSNPTGKLGPNNTLDDETRNALEALNSTP